MSTSDDSQWPLWEVFTQGARGEPFEHAGSVHAADENGSAPFREGV